MYDDPKLLPWVDIETTGLLPTDEGAAILEIGFAITDADLEIIDSVSYVIQPEHHWFITEDIVLEMHTKSGLLDHLENKQTTRLYDAVHGCKSFLRQYVEPTTRPLCGSSLGFDRAWMATFCPDLNDEFHYRSIDVSAVKEIVARFTPDWAFTGPEPVKAHRVDPDIIDSVNEFKAYLDPLTAGFELARIIATTRADTIVLGPIHRPPDKGAPDGA